MIKFIKDIVVELILKGKIVINYYSVLFFFIDWLFYLIKML